MRESSKDRILSILKPKQPRAPWEFARDEVDFSLVPTYETPLHTPYDPEMMPYWKEPVACENDPDVEECWVVKAARMGASENLILNPIRYHVAEDPMPILYVSGNQKSVERFMDKRIKLGLRASPTCAKKLDRARALEHEIYFDDMDLVTTWPTSKMAFKQSGYKRIYADEVSVWPSFSPDMLRKRADTYSFSFIMGLSSLDPQQKRPTDEDPIYIEFMNGDQRYWMMPDPRTGKLFKFAMGSRHDGWGLMWDPKAKDEDGNWDFKRVRKSAYFRTPDGTKITNAKRLAVIAKGRWVPTNKLSSEGIRSYHISAFYSPFKSGDFGRLAEAFLKHKARGHQQLRVFVYEYLAEKWDQDVERTEDDRLQERSLKYKKGTLLSLCEQRIDPKKSATYEGIYQQKKKTVFVTADVQKGHLWAVAREWIDGGDSGLLDYGYKVSWDDLEAFANEHKASRVAVDYGYEQRRIEVFEYALRFQAWPLMGRSNISISLPWKRLRVDPLEGKSGQGKNSINIYQFHADTYSGILMDMLRGESDKHWYMYQFAEREYLDQLTAMEKVDGAWQMRKGRRDNHLWDCEVMQIVMAHINKLYRMEWAEAVHS